MANSKLLATVLTALAVLILIPGIAAAQHTPPGNSGVDEYSEGVPGSGGEHPSGGNDSSGGDDGSSLPAPVAADLSDSGADGAALAAAVDATAPDSKKLQEATKAAAEGDGGGTSPVEALDTGTEGAGLSAITAAAGDSEGGMGIALPLLLIAAAVLAVVFVVARARRT